MAATLTDNVLVAHPDSGVPTFLAAGSELPEWATDLVGEHALAHEAEDDGSDEPKAIGDMTVAELKAEVDRRNDGRDDDAKLSKTGTKDELVAALTADDEAAAGPDEA